MRKGHTNISIPIKILEDIEQKRKTKGFNFSEWVTNKYTQEFLSEESILKEIQTYQNKIAELEQSIKQIIQNKESFEASIGRQEQRFLTGVPLLINEGKEWDALARRYNSMYSRNLNTREFKERVNYYAAQQRK